jgi:hypothetical protein
VDNYFQVRSTKVSLEVKCPTIRNRAVSGGEVLCGEFLVYIESILPVGIEVGVAGQRQMRYTGVIDMLAFCLQLSRLRS